MKLSMEFALTRTSTEESHTAGYTLRYALIFFGRSSVISTDRLLWVQPIIRPSFTQTRLARGLRLFGNGSVVRDFESTIDAENKTGKEAKKNLYERVLTAYGRYRLRSDQLPAYLNRGA
jgi:hypothetical protein